jgi:hypothetical protein
VYCARQPRDRENWRAGQRYLEEVSDHTVPSPLWRTNLGVDFLAPASHPKTGPSDMHEDSLKAFTRQSFLRTDFDFSGHSPKDIIVPYYVSPHPIHITLSADHRNMTRPLLFFAGGSNPPGGLRDLFFSSFLARSRSRLPSETYSEEEVVYIISSPKQQQAVSADEYLWYMQNSEFCLMMRGDTASSKRLFSAISSGCIPVIISDWIQLPFEALIDYSRFSLRFPENAFHRIEDLVHFLRYNVTLPMKEEMKNALRLVRPLLLYDYHGSLDEGVKGNYYHLLNPVTMTLIEALINRKKYCDKFKSNLVHSGTMCDKIYRRINASREDSQISSSKPSEKIRADLNLKKKKSSSRIFGEMIF